MAKTLVIAGADFSTNKLDTVVLDQIPCTGISLAESTANVSYGGTYTAVATVTPADTTQPIVWSSDNQNFNVNDGIVSVNGVGQAVITATCGSFSASVTLTSIAEFDASDFDWTDNMRMDYSGDVASLRKATDRSTMGRVSETGYHCLWSDSDTKAVGQTFCPALIPPGSTYINITYNASYGTKIGFADLSEECSQGSGGVKMLSYDSASVKVATRSVEIPEDATGYYLTLWSTDKSSLAIEFT